MDQPFPTLFAPLTLAGHVLRNRIGFAAMSTRFPGGGRVSETMVAHLAARAAGGAAMVVTEALSAAPSAATPARVAAYEEAALSGLARLAAGVAAQGALPIGQLWHGGSAHHGPRGLDAVGPSAVADGMSWTVPRVLTGGEIEGLVEDYAETAHRLQRAGFAGVEVSAAHGFLPLQFLSPVTNRREDGWGGDAAGRSRFTRAILAAIRARCGAGFVLGLKLPADDGVPGGIGPEESARLTAAIVADAPPDFLCFSQGSHGWSLRRHAPDMHEPMAPSRALWRAMRAAAGSVPIAAIGRIGTPALAEDILASGDADLVMLARPLLADPFWPAKARAGRAGAITPCLHCNACWGEIHRGVPIGCAVNPHVGTPRDAAPAALPSATRRRVAVVGAGVAGMQAALAAAARGHQVTLFGRSFGGVAALQGALPGCTDIAVYIAHQQRLLAESGITLRLGAAVDLATLLAEAPDAVVLATGARMVPPPGFVGPAQDLRSAAAALLADSKAGGACAAVLDEDATPATYDAVELLAERFGRVLLLTPREVIARDSPILVAQGVHARLAARGVEVLPLHVPESLQVGVLTLRNVLTGATRAISGVDLFAHATARTPNDALLSPLRARGIAVQTAGDVQAPRLMLSAVREGQAAGDAL
jgi:2,4-dienoyl-CoA reductase-like NADH-dependent reductase (Old Yellow Enzyme family)